MIRISSDLAGGEVRCVCTHTFKNKVPFSTTSFFDRANVNQLTYYQLTNQTINIGILEISEQEVIKVWKLDPVKLKYVIQWGAKKIFDENMPKIWNFGTPSFCVLFNFSVIRIRFWPINHVFPVIIFVRYLPSNANSLVYYLLHNFCFALGLREC